MSNLLNTKVTNVYYSTMLPKDDYSKYIEERNKLLATESRQFIGGHLNLSDHELKVNQIILNEKHKELDSTPFLPSRHFFNAKSNIEQSVIFSMLKKLPKGASLHTHLLAGVSVDYIIENITYLPNIYGCYLNNVFKMKFFQNVEANSDWKPLSMYRQNDSNFDSFLRRQISLVRDNSWDSSAAVWEQFKKSFSTCYDMLCHQPVFEDYVYQLLKELYDDNVFYTELKGTFMPLYDLNGTVYDVKHFFRTFINIVDKFKMERPDFVGVRYIHSIYRGVNDDVLKQGLQQLIEMQELFPAFIAGFDFVGYEEEGNSISDYSETLLNYSEQLKYFFHAGETNWFGHTDLNLLDAVLLNCTRIGHGFALAKHPVLMELVKEKNIALEICPISNQVLMLNSDPRNHPAASLMANGVPVVVCNDDPALWGASGLSYDWYVAFMAMTPRSSGIEVLKQFAFNSIQFSCMQNEEKNKALTLWNLKWNEFLDSFKNEIKPV